MAGHGKRYRSSYESVDREKAYDPAEAMSLIKGFKAAKFDETV
jgi:large subunit ribosomal protein L1